MSATDSLGFISLHSGETRVLASTRGDQPNTASAEAESSGGMIFTDLTMPSLEELLEERRVAFAVLERPAPTDARISDAGSADAHVDETGDVDARSLSYGEALGVFAWTAVTVGLAVAGVVLLVLGLRETPVLPDPVSAIALLLVGLGLVATLVVALRHRYRC